MQNRSDSIRVQSSVSSALIGAGAVLGSVATGAPYHPAFADALAMRSDQVALARDFWGSVSAFNVGITVVHPNQGQLFEQN